MRCFIIGNGPSIKKQDLTLLNNEVTFVTNWFVLHEEFEAINPTFYCLASGHMFYDGGKLSFNQKLYQLINSKAKQVTKWYPFPFRDFIVNSGLFPGQQIFYLPYAPTSSPKNSVDQNEKFIIDLVKPIHTSGTVIIDFCLPIAFYLGFKDIYLLGCDCDYGLSESTNERQYFFHFDHIKNYGAPSKQRLLEEWSENGRIIKSYEIVKKVAERKNVRIYNATPGGKLEVFPRVNLDAIVRN